MATVEVDTALARLRPGRGIFKLPVLQRGQQPTVDKFYGQIGCFALETERCAEAMAGCGACGQLTHGTTSLEMQQRIIHPG